VSLILPSFHQQEATQPSYLLQGCTSLAACLHHVQGCNKRVVTMKEWVRFLQGWHLWRCPSFINQGLNYFSGPHHRFVTTTPLIFHSSKTLTESPRLLLRQPWNGVLTSFAIFLLLVWNMRAWNDSFGYSLTVIPSYVSSSAMGAARGGQSLSNKRFSCCCGV
jgi:hypothetical protein